MFKLDLSQLRHYVESQKNANKAKFNLSNNLLNFLEKEGFTGEILKASLIKAYLDNSQIEEEADLQNKGYWSLGKLWQSSLGEDKLFNFEMINSFLNTDPYKETIVKGIPSSLPTKYWYQSQKLHTIIYNLYQQALEYEKKLLEEIECFNSLTADLMRPF
ncbi:Uncharacterised protein [Legionella beliardensis]|uniref:Uncharacterized protein n=1 Tax=Legionella beliardensis TaxID=91822 RepID=A0A378IA13_9GAMM|nr:hypothetical protein [Legionella beliardensis]STX29184.1 Uncharacterised protein [Legionella beliardensis]